MRNLITMVAILMFTSIAAQDFSGMAIYKTDRKVSVKLDSSQTSSGQIEFIQKQLKLAMQKEFQLSFNRTESNWKEEENLNKPIAANSGIEVRVTGNGGGNGLLYKNTKDKKMCETTDSFGKLFLVADALKEYEWELTSETKQIGKYTCYKAIAKEESERINISRVNGESDKKEETQVKTVTAWYTPEIPVNHGPGKYWGLPGLILEVGDGSKIMICTRVILNPEETVEITIPSKGKKVNGEEYREIIQEQAEKMTKMFGGGKKKGENNAFEIRIGG